MENNFLLESLAACHDANSKLVMYFTVNTAFVNYLDSLNNLTNSLKTLILLNRTTYKQTLPISLPPPEFDSKLLTATKTLKDFVHHIQQKREISYLQERHTNTEELPSKNFFFNNILDVFLFVTAILLLLVTMIVIYILRKQKKLKTLVDSLALQQVKEVGAVATQEPLKYIECTCKI